MKRLRIVLIFASLASIAVASAGDTIINSWGAMSYGWINTETFGIQFEGGEQVRQIVEEWPECAFFITNDAHRFQDNIHTWQIRKSAQGEFLLVIPNDFAAAKSYKINPAEQEQEGEEGSSISEFTLAIPTTFETQKMIAVGDPVAIHLSWKSELLLFTFTIPAQPDMFDEP